VGFSCPANNTFIITIPGNIDKIRIQAWGPGGIGVGTAANFSASGGGGGYVEAIVGGVGNKIMGIIVGENPNLNTALDVKTTWVAVNNLEFKALAGENASNDLTMIAMRGGEGGGFTVVNSNPGESSGRSWIGFKGQPGSDIQYRFDQINATTFARSMIGGNGGDGAMTMNTGGKGFYQYFNQTTNSPIAQARSYNGLTPGGGGGAPLYVFTDVNQTGGNGLVIISFAHSTVTNSTPPTPNNPPPDRSSNQQR
jgi:hypothetical protein